MLRSAYMAQKFVITYQYHNFQPPSERGIIVVDSELGGTGLAPLSVGVDSISRDEQKVCGDGASPKTPGLLIKKFSKDTLALSKLFSTIGSLCHSAF